MGFQVRGAPLRADPVGVVALAGVCVLAAAAPIAPSTLQSHGLWAAAVVVLLRVRHMTLLDGCAVAVAAWVTVASIGNGWLAESQATVRAYWSVLAVFVAVRCAARRPGGFTAVGCAYLAGCLYVAVDIIGQSRLVEASVGGGQARLGFGSVNANYTAYALVTGVITAVALLRASPMRRPLRAALYTTIAVTGYATFWTGTRGAQVAVVLVAVYLLAAAAAGRAVWITSVVAAATLLVIVPAGVYGDQRLLWWQQFFDRQDDSLSGRFYVWDTARTIWAEHPWTGIGPGMFPLSNMLGIGAHNFVLTVGAELGLIGLLLYASVIVGALIGTGGSGPAGPWMVGLLLVGWLPIWLSGHWELSPAAWVVLAAWSRARLRRPAHRRAVRVGGTGDVAALSGHSYGNLPRARHQRRVREVGRQVSQAGDPTGLPGRQRQESRRHGIAGVEQTLMGWHGGGGHDQRSDRVPAASNLVERPRQRLHVLGVDRSEQGDVVGGGRH